MYVGSTILVRLTILGSIDDFQSSRIVELYRGSTGQMLAILQVFRCTHKLKLGQILSDHMSE
jgi:hypothetical protein